MLQEGNTAPPERLLQAVWYHQRLQRDELRTADGRRVRVLHPGFWNHEAGPDFHHAVVQFDAAAPVTGDVEVDLLPAGWQGHGHWNNPAYRNVVLHVVWQGNGTPDLPTLALQSTLDAPLEELQQWLGVAGRPVLPAAWTGKCNGPLRELTPEIRHELLLQAAHIRLQARAAQLQARARQAGWEQTLWEGLFRALGYKQNPWPMQRLAELKSHWLPPAQPPLSPLSVQARLFGLSGLLPADLTRQRAVTDDYLRRIWDLWWRERERFSDLILPRTAWRFNGIRPANHPQRRLALASHWLAANNLPARLEQWFTADLSAPHLVNSLLETLAPSGDEYWSWHWTLNSTRMTQPQPLLGPARVTDLAINVILPWLWIRAVTGENAALRTVAEQRYFAWPAAEDNAVLRLARQRLLANLPGRRFKTAAEQQGLLQIDRDFCSHANALCESCRFPELVRGIVP